MSEKNDKIIDMDDRVQPMRVTDNKSNKVYELDFSRESVRFAEARGFEIDTVIKFPATRIPELFYYSFRKNHKSMSRKQTDDLFDMLGGLTGAMLERLIQLYNQSALTHVIATEEDASKNEKVTVEM